MSKTPRKQSAAERDKSQQGSRITLPRARKRIVASTDQRNMLPVSISPAVQLELRLQLSRVRRSGGRELTNSSRLSSFI